MSGCDASGQCWVCKVGRKKRAKPFAALTDLWRSESDTLVAAVAEFSLRRISRRRQSQFLCKMFRSKSKIRD